MDWPDRAVKFDPPLDTEESRDVWQGALDLALETGTLVLVASTVRNNWQLAGRCPRCDHQTRMTLHMRVVRGVSPKHSFNFDCACGKSHRDLDGDEHDSCGWGGPLKVQVDRRTWPNG